MRKYLLVVMVGLTLTVLAAGVKAEVNDSLFQNLTQEELYQQVRAYLGLGAYWSAGYRMQIILYRAQKGKSNSEAMKAYVTWTKRCEKDMGKISKNDQEEFICGLKEAVGVKCE